MARERAWADNIVRVSNDISKRFYEEWKKSGLVFGEFCEQLLGQNSMESKLQADLRAKREHLMMLQDNYQREKMLIEAQIEALEEAIVAEKKSFEDAIKRATHG